MKNLKNQTTEFLLSEESRLITLIDKLSGYRHFMKNQRGTAKTTLSVVQQELNRR